MFIGTSDIFKIGIGPSSSHTMGPMSAGFRFLNSLCERQKEFSNPVSHIQASVHGSLAYTGKGHATDKAICLGLMGFEPASLNAEQVADCEAELHAKKIINHSQLGQVRFDPQTDLIFDYEVMLPEHTNGMQFFAYDASGTILISEIYYSIGGGFIRRDDEMHQQDDNDGVENHPFAFTNAGEMLAM